MRAEHLLCEDLDRIISPPPQVALAVGYSVIVYPCLSLLPFGVFVLVSSFVVCFLVSILQVSS